MNSDNIELIGKINYMVLLISGTSYTGKTLMAQTLLEKYKMPYLSIDHLKMGLYRSGYDCGFTPETNYEIITKKIWPIIKGIIMTNIENNQNIIIEGCYFPESIDDLEKEYTSKILFIYIIFSEKYIRNNLLEKIIENRSIIENRGYEFECSEEMIEEYILENKINKEKCIKNNIKYIEVIDNYAEEMKLLYNWIDKEIKNI